MFFVLFFVFKQATTSNYNTCYCYSQVSRTNICVTRLKMSHRSKSVKRPRPDSSRSRPAGSHHQAREAHAGQGPGPSGSRSQDRPGRQGARHQHQAQHQPTHGADTRAPSSRPGTAPRPHINPVFQFKPGDLARVSQESNEARYRDQVGTY